MFTLTKPFPEVTVTRPVQLAVTYSILCPVGEFIGNALFDNKKTKMVGCRNCSIVFFLNDEFARHGGEKVLLKTQLTAALAGLSALKVPVRITPSRQLQVTLVAVETNILNYY